MANFSTKHTPQFRDVPELDTVTGDRGTLMDDMTVVRYVCLPERNNPEIKSSIVFGDDPKSYRSLVRDSYPPQPRACEPPDVRRARAADMNSRHWGWYDAPPDPHVKHPPFAPDAYHRRPAFGGSSSKTESHLPVNPDDVSTWQGDLVSEMQRKYLRPAAPRADADGAIARDATASHFALGMDAPDYSRKEYAVATSVPPRPVNEMHRSSVPLRVSTPEPAISQAQASYRGEPGEPPTRTKGAPHVTAHVYLGSDPRETKTTQREAFKQPRYVDCSNLTEMELTALGLTRHRLEDVPLSYRDTPEYQTAVAEIQEQMKAASAGRRPISSQRAAVVINAEPPAAVAEAARR
eukprot:TRINITY_DN2694_c0_g1_i1.p1 TRINITY_DN2694_c0_g1~~TRINITY_DN2694_c0_g1_i1.p1  ORF type:complete len:350 (-),score=46.77 TRINITY_DN2694_c0_g1_i1:222-1271(-)